LESKNRAQFKCFGGDIEQKNTTIGQCVNKKCYFSLFRAKNAPSKSLNGAKRNKRLGDSPYFIADIA
jgi:hypothetical protein